MPKRKTVEDAPLKDTKMRDDDESSSSDVRLNLQEKKNQSFQKRNRKLMEYANRTKT